MGPFLIQGCLDLSALTIFIEIPEFNTNGVDPDQMSLFAASDLGLHCLPMTHFWDTRHK